MKQPLVIVALALALASTAMAGYALRQAPPGAGEVEARLVAVEDQLSTVERDLALLREANRPPPSLMGIGPGDVDTARPAAAPPMATEGGGQPSTGTAPNVLGVSTPEGKEALAGLVDAAVEKKAAQMVAMRQKKPGIDAFASVLELDEEQRAVVEREVVQSQKEIRDILTIPAEDGTVFMDELVDILARGIAQPGQNKGAGMKLFQRLMTEKVPGSDQTYAEQAEAVKSRLRGTFKRTFNARQYATFEAWQMDPSEVQKIPGSPWKEVEVQVRERARALGAELPGDDGPR